MKFSNLIWLFGLVFSQMPFVQANEIIDTGTLHINGLPSGDYFGSSMAIYGDTLVIGATGDDANASGVNPSINNDDLPNSGAVYVYQNVASEVDPEWVLQAFIKASNPDIDDEFGHSVDIYEDILVVSAMKEDSSSQGINGNQESNSGTDAGAVYVFIRNEHGQWNQEAYIKPEAITAFDYFGSSVALWGDRLIVGAFGEDSKNISLPNNNENENSGAAYVFLRDITGWRQSNFIKTPFPDAGDSFGHAVDIHGNTFVVAASNEDSDATGINGTQDNNNALSSGAVYMYEINGSGNVMFRDYIKASNTEAFDHFGSAVSLSHDKLVVSATHEDSGSGLGQEDNSVLSAGAVYVFARNDGELAQEAFIKPEVIDAHDEFGHAVVLSGGLLMVSAIGESSGLVADPEDNSVRNSGAMYIFTQQGGQWIEEAYLKDNPPRNAWFFGSRMAAHGRQFFASGEGFFDEGFVHGYLYYDTIFKDSFKEVN